MSKHLFSFELNYAGFFNDVQFEYAERSINERLTIETEGGCLHRKNYAFFFRKTGWPRLFAGHCIHRKMGVLTGAVVKTLCTS